jgi:hypothetical protein
MASEDDNQRMKIVSQREDCGSAQHVNMLICCSWNMRLSRQMRREGMNHLLRGSDAHEGMPVVGGERGRLHVYFWVKAVATMWR